MSMLPSWVNKMQRNQTGQDFLKIFLFEVFLFGIEVRMKLYYSLVTVIFALREKKTNNPVEARFGDFGSGG